MRVVVALLACLLLIQPVAAQAEGFLRLGTDPSGDAKLAGNANPDTIFDILYLDVATEDTNIVFDLGLRGTSTEAGSACFVAAFQVGGTEYLAFDCFECAAYECTNAITDVRAPSSSRGERVGSVELTDATARITVGFAEIGVGVGDVISDIYGLTYTSRALIVADAAPDAKSSATAGEGFGEYYVGYGRSLPVADEGPVAMTVYENLNETSATAAFANATSDTYVYNFTSNLTDAQVLFNWTIANGNASVSLKDASGYEHYAGVISGNFSDAVELRNATAGAWNLTVQYENFTGAFAFSMGAIVDDGGSGEGGAGQGDGAGNGSGSGNGGNTTGNETVDGAGAAGKESPGVAFPLLTLGLVAAAFALRRRN